MSCTRCNPTCSLPLRTNNQLRHVWRCKAKMSDGDDTQGPNDETPDAAALYIGSLALELAKIARRIVALLSPTPVLISDTNPAP